MWEWNRTQEEESTYLRRRMTEKSVKDESRKDDYNFGEKQRKLKDVINLKNIKFLFIPTNISWRADSSPISQRIIQN